MLTLLGLELQLVWADVEFSELASGGKGHLTLFVFSLFITQSIKGQGYLFMRRL